MLPPELLRTLPEWRALVVRTNLSPGRRSAADGLAALGLSACPPDGRGAPSADIGDCLGPCAAVVAATVRSG